MAEETLEQVFSGSLHDLTGVVAVVTGGCSGIGMMISSTLLANGATVFIIDKREDLLDSVTKSYNAAAEKLGRQGGFIPLAGDISKKSEAKRLGEEVGKRVPYVTVLFNNAGISEGNFNKPKEAKASAFVTSFFDEIEEESFYRVLSVNAVAPYWLTFAFLPLLEKWKEAGYGSEGRRFPPQVVMTSSMNGWTKDSDTSGRSYPYLFSKSAIGHATATLARELLPLGIRVNGIAPGLFISGMSVPGSTNELGQSSCTDLSKFDFQVPTPQLPVELGGPKNVGGSFKDIASLILFLVSNWYVNGETVLIDGGTLLVHASSY
ncbi:NAD-P-binding protein [Panus rudis PR-1116 ss-1]|nr:NAD-P-binding protein [Panus rudis PR-1116 ss-1]